MGALNSRPWYQIGPLHLCNTEQCCRRAYGQIFDLRLKPELCLMTVDEFSDCIISTRKQIQSQGQKSRLTVHNIQEATSEPVLGERMLEARRQSKSLKIVDPCAGMQRLS